MKQRLDLIILERNLAPTRTAAQAMIMAGEIRHKSAKLTKPGQLFDANIELTVAQKSRYVSRAGDKLASVADHLKLNFDGAIVLDVGSSTGGFTDYCLQNGAAKVYAVDVGTNQLAYKLRQDGRIVLMEQTDIRDVQPNELSPIPDIAVIDTSFISLTKILPVVEKLIKNNGHVVAMAKPQFETDKPTADRYKGVIKDEAVRQQILSQLEDFMEQHFQILDSADSAVTGAQGNRERFYLLAPKAHAVSTGE